MADPIKVFLITETNRYVRSFRRYTLNGLCPNGAYHNTNRVIGMVETDEHPVCKREPETERDLRWPTKCENCDYEFDKNDEWQVFYSILYCDEHGNNMTLQTAPPGACWDAWWMYRDYGPIGDVADEEARGPDGRCLVVKCPNGVDWHIDSRALNCTMPNDNAHKCWVRHGSPEEGNLHVDKNGHTCGAGAGSIRFTNFHGFLHQGYIIEA